MIILTEPISRDHLMEIEEHTYFEDMMKCLPILIWAYWRLMQIFMLI